MSSYQPSVDQVILASNNEKEGLYEFIVHLEDGTKCRTFYNRFPEWELTNINRLQQMPCPVCRKDFICNCMSSYAGDIHQQLKEGQWFERLTAH